MMLMLAALGLLRVGWTGAAVCATPQCSAAGRAAGRLADLAGAARGGRDRRQATHGTWHMAHGGRRTADGGRRTAAQNSTW